MKHLTRIAVVLAVAGLCSACAVSSFTTGRTLDKGTSRFYVAPSLQRISVGGSPGSIPMVELGTRYGYSDKLEFAARVGAGIGVDVKIALARAATPTAGTWDIAVMPGIGYIGNFSGTPTGSDGDDLHFMGATVAALFTHNTTDSLSITAAPRIAHMLQYVETDGGSATNILAPGISLSASFKVSDALHIIPEVGMTTAIMRTLSDFGSDIGFGGQRVMQFGIAFVFGK